MWSGKKISNLERTQSSKIGKKETFLEVGTMVFKKILFEKKMVNTWNTKKTLIFSRKCYSKLCFLRDFKSTVFLKGYKKRSTRGTQNKSLGNTTHFSLLVLISKLDIVFLTIFNILWPLFNSSCPRNMEEFGNGRKNARTFLKFQSLF